MIVQWCRDDEEAAIVDGRAGPDALAEAKMLGCPTLANADARLHTLGWRRRQAWQPTMWGYEARIRRRRGRGILPTLLGQAQPEEDRCLIWVRREGGRYGGRAYYAARHGDFKLVQNGPFEPYELYNLRDDPLEEHPLPRSHKAYRRLFDALREHVNRSGAVPWQPPDAPRETAG